MFRNNDMQHVLHYLNDFLIIIIASGDFAPYNEIFNMLCKKLSFNVNATKNKIHIINDFLKIELDTLRMKARLPSKKLKKAIKWVNTALGKKFISIENLQSLVGFLAFAAKVVVSGRVFFRRFYDALNAKHFNIRLFATIKNDFRWGRDFLPKGNEIRILRKNRPIIKIGTDVFDNYGIDDYMLHENENIKCMPAAQMFFKRFFIKLKSKHINVKEMMVILHALNFYELNAVDFRIMLHCDNFAVVKNLKKSFIKKKVMQFLRAI